jgi:hypothetical protein
MAKFRTEDSARTLNPAEAVGLGRSDWSNRADALLQAVHGVTGKLTGSYGSSGGPAQLERQAIEAPSWLLEQLAMAHRQLDAAAAACREGIDAAQGQ